jgi:O-antigen/teichoic acid export membrane protein
MQEAKKFALDVSLTFIASIINMLLTFVISIILGRYLGATDLGLYRLTYTFYGVATMVGALGIPAAVIKYVAEYKEDKANLNRIVSSAIITSLLVGIFFSITLYLSSQILADIFRMPQIKGLLEILAPVFPFVLINSILYGTLNGLRDMNKYAMSLILQQVLMAIFTAILIYSGFGVAGAMISIVLSSIGASMYLIYCCKGLFNFITREYIKTTKKLIGFGTQMFGANLINMINLQADTVFVGYFLTAADVGYYSAATGLSKFFWVMPQAIQTISYPATSDYWAKKDILGLQKMLDNSMKYSALALMPAGLTIGLFAEDIVVMIYGPGFSQSALPLQILLVGTILFGVACTSIGGSLAGANRPDLSLKAAGISASANIILNFILINEFGIIGASMAAAISLIIMATLFGIMTVRTLSLKLDLKWLLMAVITALLGIGTFYIGSINDVNTYILGGGVLIAYTIILFKIVLNKVDLKLLDSLKLNSAIMERLKQRKQ